MAEIIQYNKPKRWRKPMYIQQFMKGWRGGGVVGVYRHRNVAAPLGIPPINFYPIFLTIETFLYDLKRKSRFLHYTM